jgi:hypothetical protein
MHGTLRHHGYTTGCSLWVVITVALGLTLGQQATAAQECARATLLPAEVHLIAPGAEVPEAVARFAGVWTGAWLDKGREAVCHTLVVEEVFTNGYARVIYSIGTYAGWDIRQPQFWRATGRIVDGTLRFRLPVPERPDLAYWFAGAALQGTFKGEGSVSLTRMADLSQVGCGPQVRDVPQAPPATGPRDRLTADEFLAQAYTGDGPVHNAYFLPVGQAAPAVHAFKGTLTIGASTMFSAHRGCDGLPRTMSGFSVAFFTHGEHLVPVVRDILQPPGTLILSPGQVWSEPGDQGMSRAAFPFVMTNPYNNGTHNGLATFLYDDTRVSALRFQVVQETAMWAKFDFWGQAPLSYNPGPLANEDALRAQFATELQHQTPIRPWSALPTSAVTPWLERFDGDAVSENISANGLIVDGVIYLRGCHTRYGPYPYCRHMRHGVFSVTKSLGAALTLLRLAQKYGDGVFDLKIKDYVTVTATHDGWERVTFGDVLNMATGIGDLAPQREPNDPVADENKPKMFQWMRARTAKDKLAMSFSYGKYAWGPGEVLRYNSTQTFVLAAAMESFLKHQVGPHAHLWDMVTAEVLQPIGVFHAPLMHTQEADGGRGIPHLLHGLYPTIDDLAKLTTLLQNGGQHQGQQLLSATKLAEALYKTNAVGLPNSRKNRFGEGRYHLSFWSVPYRTSNGCFFQIPYMAGYGGNLVVLLPNGISAFRFADGENWDLDAMVLAGEALRPFCPAGSGAEPLPARQRQSLTASDLRAEFPDNTFYADRLHMFPAAGGVIYGTLPEAIDVGTWHITPDGQFCRTWHVWDVRRERCYTVYREGEVFELYMQDRWGKVVLRRASGNPEGY